MIRQIAFTKRTISVFEMTRRSAAVEIPATHPNHRAFVEVMPPLPENRIYAWRVRKFEIPEELMETNFSEDALVNSMFVRLKPIEEVEALIAAWGLDSAAFDAPWKVDYPL